MIILTVYRSVLLSAPSVASKLNGGVLFEWGGQDIPRPNIILQMPESGQDYSHQGPVGLIDGHLRVISRAETFQAATELGDAVQSTLETWTGTLFGHAVQKTEHFNSMSAYDDGAKIFTRTDEFTAFFTRTS